MGPAGCIILHGRLSVWRPPARLAPTLDTRRAPASQTLATKLQWLGWQQRTTTTTRASCSCPSVCPSACLCVWLLRRRALLAYHCSFRVVRVSVCVCVCVEQLVQHWISLSPPSLLAPNSISRCASYAPHTLAHSSIRIRPRGVRLQRLKAAAAISGNFPLLSAAVNSLLASAPAEVLLLRPEKSSIFISLAQTHTHTHTRLFFHRNNLATSAHTQLPMPIHLQHCYYCYHHHNHHHPMMT